MWQQQLVRRPQQQQQHAHGQKSALQPLSLYVLLLLANHLIILAILPHGSYAAPEAAPSGSGLGPSRNLQQVAYQGELQILYISDSAINDHPRLYLLVLSETLKYVLDLSHLSGLPPLLSGMTVKATGPFNSASNSVQVKSLTILKAPPLLPVTVPGQAQNISSVVFLLEICGRKLNLDPGVMRASWTDGWGTPLYGRTMQQYYDTCSFGKVAFSPDNNVVLGPISLPCSGTGSAGPWDARYCRTQELLGWTEAAMAAAQAAGLLAAERLQRPHNRRVVVLPAMPACGWAGMGSVGCGSSCMAFTLDAYALQLDTLFHELGHNMGLLHSTTPGVEYGDCSCAMGGCYSYRCYNAPQAWRLGWYTPIAKIGGSTAPSIGQWLSYNLPAAQLSDTNHVIIRPSWTTAVSSTFGFFVSYREAVGGDSGLQSGYRNRVSVHQMDNVLDPAVFQKPVLLSLLDPGAEFVDASTSVKVRYVQQLNGAAAVAVCRYKVATDCIYSSPVSPSAAPSPSAVPSPSAAPSPLAAPSPTGQGCGPNPRCGDGFCDAWAGESCRTCAQDCSGKLEGSAQWCCGSNTKTGCSGSDKCGGPSKCRDVCPGVPYPPPHPHPPQSNVSPPPPSSVSSPPPPLVRTGYKPPPPGQGCASYPNPSCGDGFCDTWAGEDCRNCPQDCSGNLFGYEQWCCGYKTKTGCGSEKCGGPGKCREACP